MRTQTLLCKSRNGTAPNDYQLQASCRKYKTPLANDNKPGVHSYTHICTHNITDRANLGQSHYQQFHRSKSQAQSLLLRSSTQLKQLLQLLCHLEVRLSGALRRTDVNHRSPQWSQTGTQRACVLVHLQRHTQKHVSHVPEVGWCETQRYTSIKESANKIKTDSRHTAMLHLSN